MSELLLTNYYFFEILGLERLISYTPLEILETACIAVCMLVLVL